jgi:lipopolysaccharide/colanic/teichoic acid biosynthesis glycosyltransferase
MADIINLLDSSIYFGVARPKNSWIEKVIPDEALFRGKTYDIAKRVMDIILVLLLIPFILPLCILIAFLIKLDSPNGRVIFVQNRTGKNCKRFKMCKFRSMVPNAEELKKELNHLKKLKWPDFKVTNDPRVTRVGHILRITSLDELPQFLNVLKGEMSLVGPRPTSFKPETYDLWQTERLEVLPGITGLWQIMRRGETEYCERLRLDIAYIKHRSLWLDIQILFRTVFVVISRRGAY